MILKGSKKNEGPCLIPDFSGNAWNFSLLSRRLATGLLWWPLLCWDIVPLYLVSVGLSSKRDVGFLWNTFLCRCWDDQEISDFEYCFALIGRQTLNHPLPLWIYTDIIVEGLDGVVLNSVCKDFVDSFAFLFIREIGLYFLCLISFYLTVSVIILVSPQEFGRILSFSVLWSNVRSTGFSSSWKGLVKFCAAPTWTWAFFCLEFSFHFCSNIIAYDGSV